MSALRNRCSSVPPRPYHICNILSNKADCTMVRMHQPNIDQLSFRGTGGDFWVRSWDRLLPCHKDARARWVICWIISGP